MKRKLKIIIPAFILIAAVSFVLFFEFYLKDTFDTVQRVVAIEEIAFKEVFTEENIEVRNIRRDYAITNGYDAEDVSSLIGKHASIDISLNSQLSSGLVDQFNLIPNEAEGEFIAPIPNSWIFAVAGSMRSTYFADFYAVPDDEARILQTLIKDSEEQHEVIENDDQEVEIQQDEEIIEIEEGEENLYASTNEVPILSDVRVSSVRDGGNREVRDNAESQSTGSISSLEIIADDDSLQTIRDYTENGYKIYIVYKFGR